MEKKHYVTHRVLHTCTLWTRKLISKVHSSQSVWDASINTSIYRTRGRLRKKVNNSSRNLQHKQTKKARPNICVGDNYMIGKKFVFHTVALQVYCSLTGISLKYFPSVTVQCHDTFKVHRKSNILYLLGHYHIGCPYNSIWYPLISFLT